MDGGTVWSVAALAFVVASIPSVVVAILIRRRLGAGPDPASGLDSLRVAYLAGEIGKSGGGPRRTVLAGIADLRARKVILITPWGNSGITGDPPADLDDLRAAIYEAASDNLARQDIFATPTVLSSVGRIRDRLVAEGWILSKEVADRWRRTRLIPLGAVGLGFALMATAPFVDPAAEPPPWVVSAFGWTFCPLLAFELALLTASAPALSRSARRAITMLREQHGHLEPSRKPSWAKVGAQEASLGVALYGEAAIHASDPAYTGEQQ